MRARPPGSRRRRRARPRRRRARADIDADLQADRADLEIGAGVEQRILIGLHVQEEHHPPVAQADEQVLAAIVVPVDDAGEETQAALAGHGQVARGRLGVEVGREDGLGDGPGVEVHANPGRVSAAALSDNEIRQAVAVPVGEGGDGISGDIDVAPPGLDVLLGAETEVGQGG